MRILPVNNYNYQSKTQNNQKQNVNFGMICGTPAEAKGLCKAGFFNVEDAIAALVRKAEAAFRMGNAKKPVRVFLDAKENFTLHGYLKAAREKNVVMSPEEEQAIAALFELPETELPNKAFLGILEAEIEEANPVTKPIQAKLTRLEFCSSEKERLDNLFRESSTQGSAVATMQQRDAYAAEANRIQQELYAESVAI